MLLACDRHPCTFLNCSQQVPEHEVSETIRNMLQLTAGWKDRWERGGLGLSAPWAAASDATATDTPGPRAQGQGDLGR